MSDLSPDLYEIVEKRIDQRNRRRLFWAFDLMILIASLALMIAGGDTGYENLLVSGFLFWGGVFTLHSIWLYMREMRSSDIETEVAKLQQIVYEKPKRLALSDEGEMIDPLEDDYDDQRRAKLMSR